MATHSSTLTWKIPWMEEPGRLQSMGLLRVVMNTYRVIIESNCFLFFYFYFFLFSLLHIFSTFSMRDWSWKGGWMRHAMKNSNNMSFLFMSSFLCF